MGIALVIIGAGCREIWDRSAVDYVFDWCFRCDGAIDLWGGRRRNRIESFFGCHLGRFKVRNVKYGQRGVVRVLETRKTVTVCGGLCSIVAEFTYSVSRS